MALASSGPTAREVLYMEAQSLASIIREVAPFPEAKEARNLANQVLIQTLTKLLDKETA